MSFISSKDLKVEFKDVLVQSIRCLDFERSQTVLGCFLMCNLKDRQGCGTFKEKVTINQNVLNLKIADVINPESPEFASYVKQEELRERKRKKRRKL